eukprot:186089-Ditylum_brightwellii.AAC.1
MALKNTSTEKFLNHHKMNDENMIEAMKFLQILLSYSFFAKQEKLPIIIEQMMQLTIRHGVCKESFTALAYLSFLLCSLEYFKDSDYIGQLAIALVDMLKANEYLPQVYLAYFSGAASWIRGAKLTLESLLHGYQVGMQIGDIENAMLSALSFSLESFIHGR